MATEYANQVKIAQLTKTIATIIKVVLVWLSSVGCSSAWIASVIPTARLTKNKNFLVLMAKLLVAMYL